MNPTPHVVFALALPALFTACGSDNTNPPDASAPRDVVTTMDAPSTDTPVVNDTPIANDTPVAMDAPAATLRRCPTSGRGSVPGDHCFLLTPVETGLAAAGANATVDQYALRPTAAARGRLLVFFNGSGGSPRGGLSNTDVSFYSVARELGFHVLAVSYRSDDSIGSLCATAADRDACFLGARATVITGAVQAGAPMALMDVSRHEGIYVRLAAALAALDTRDPMGGWGAYYDRASLDTPARAIRWSSLYVSGHSQGGGHAALVGRLHAVDRVLMLASPCDNTRGTPAAWLTRGASYATDPSTRYWGLGAPGDVICDAYAAAWESLGMAPSARMADAALCAGEGAHSAPIHCAENAERWRTMLR